MGNYFRAKRAQERQKQRRMSKLTGSASNVGRASREAGYSSSFAGESNDHGYEAPDPSRNVGVSA